MGQFQKLIFKLFDYARPACCTLVYFHDVSIKTWDKGFFFGFAHIWAKDHSFDKHFAIRNT